MLVKVIKRIKRDDGNAVAILGLMLIMSGLLVGGMMLDFTKAYQMKGAYVDSAKKATQSGIRYQTTQGDLTPLAAAEAVRTYETVTRPSVINDGSLSNCQAGTGKSGRNVEIRVFYREPDFSSTFDNSFDEDAVVSETTPVFSINSNQVSPTDSAENILMKMTKKNEDRVNSGGYTGLQMQVIESTPNLILPGAFGMTGSTGNESESIRCQYLGINAGASQFIGHEDGEFD